MPKISEWSFPSQWRNTFTQWYFVHITQLVVLDLPLVVILKAAPLTPLVLPPLICECVCAGRLAGRDGEAARGDGGRGVRRFAGGGGERHASRLIPPVKLFGLSLRFRASLWIKNIDDGYKNNITNNWQ